MGLWRNSCLRRTIESKERARIPVVKKECVKAGMIEIDDLLLGDPKDRIVPDRQAIKFIARHATKCH
tara:strand:- start:584 stop:784 length:201 start_codon:yes stop_codon:yes gene_type:complete